MGVGGDGKSTQCSGLSVPPHKGSGFDYWEVEGDECQSIRKGRVEQ
jgi:hypothetical protein